MARFYAEIQGSRGSASRLGTPQSGIAASIKSWQGQIDVSIHARGDVDWVYVGFREHGARVGGVTLYDGPADGWRRADKVGTLGRMLVEIEQGELTEIPTPRPHQKAA